ncbi:MAG: hypothetical protein COA78_34435 [Blastopirellula sp.]|nr:MAG: hypothetical protein COA78_34435 [Blastopirellula sp.]
MSLELLEQGTLSRPGSIGRMARLSLGLFCTYALWEITNIAADFIEQPIRYLPNLSLMLVAPICIFNYVINIGYSKDWHRYPLIVSLVFFVVIALGGYVINGDANSTLLGIALLAWLGYFFSHLGVSFLIAAVLATPGCEMRAIPELFGKITGKASNEHHCPVSIISGIDNWERKRRGK